ncbi:MAG TPA: NAD(P)/FAD-dependent oxidoreductase [Acidimicrobiales bacterium]|nr:NAD(P)/FAD-dependent oxidoreductase [Acidimicrobiales bacterium]
MSEYDAIVIGAGHNGLTAAAVMARGGLRVLCLEKNHFIGGMASTTELIRGFRFELAGSIQFPVPNEIYEDLDLASCPIYEPEVQSASISEGGQPPIFLYSDPDRLLEHLGATLGIEAVLGMAEVTAWAEAPARAIGRFDVRRPPRSFDEMYACATNEAERDAIRMAMFGSVLDVVDRYLPDRSKHAPVRSMLSFLAVNSTFRGPATPGSALCLAFALASPGTATMSKVRGGLGTIADHLLHLFERHGGELRRHAKVSRIVTEDGAVQGVELGAGEVVTAPVVVSNLDPTATFLHLLDAESLPDAFVRRVEAIDHRALYFQAHFALNGLPEYREPYAAMNGTTFGRNVTFFGTAEQMQLDFEGCVRGEVPRSPSFNLQIPSIDDPTLAPEGMHAASSFAFYLPIGTDRESQGRLRDEMAARIVDKIAAAAPNFPDLVERQLNYPAYTYELMFGCTGGDFTHGLLQPEFMGPFRPGALGWPDNPVPVEGLYLCGAGCHGGPGVTFIPGYNCGYAVLEGTSARL